MKNTEYENFILLHTFDKSVLMIESNPFEDDFKKLNYCKLFGFDYFDEKNNFAHTNKQNLYLTSREKIQKDDWVIYHGKVMKCTKTEKIFGTHIVILSNGFEIQSSDCRKIIESTDESISVPRISHEKIMEYINYYNNNLIEN